VAVRSPVINVMANAALKAARGLIRDFGEVEQLQVSIKGPGDFVSTADLRAERTLRNELSRNGVYLRTELASNLPRVHGDPVQLQQVLINLIMNAIEAMRSSTARTRELLIRSATHRDGVLVQVQDSGPGVEPELRDRIFEPFFTTKAEGIGMGLLICRSIIESHGGRLSLVPDSEGTLFQFTLPVEPNGAS